MNLLQSHVLRVDLTVHPQGSDDNGVPIQFPSYLALVISAGIHGLVSLRVTTHGDTRIHESMSRLEGKNAVHGERGLWRRMHRRYSCHVMLAFGILCKGLTYY